jgi:hypothetical protein
VSVLVSGGMIGETSELLLSQVVVTEGVDAGTVMVMVSCSEDVVDEHDVLV